MKEKFRKISLLLVIVVMLSLALISACTSDNGGVAADTANGGGDEVVGEDEPPSLEDMMKTSQGFAEGEADSMSESERKATQRAIEGLLPEDIPVLSERNDDLAVTDTEISYTSFLGQYGNTVTFYTDEMSANGWTLSSEEKGDTEATLVFEKDGRKATVVIKKNNQGSSVLITLE